MLVLLKMKGSSCLVCFYSNPFERLIILREDNTRDSEGAGKKNANFPST